MQVCKKLVRQYEEEVEQVVEEWIKQVSTICEDLPWPLDWFCKVVTAFVKVVWTVLTTIVKTVITVVCYTIALAATILGNIINVVLTIPVVGPLVKAFLGGVAWLWSQFVGLVDAGLGLIGLRPIKNLRLHVIILMHPDRTLTVPVTDVGPAIQLAQSIFRDRADVKIEGTVHQVETPSPRGALYVDSGTGLLGEELTEAGFYFQSVIRDLLWEHSALFALRIGAPIVAFVVDGVGTTDDTADDTGCSSGPIADYVCIEGAEIRAATDVLAHELAHACGLSHDNEPDTSNGDITNLMYFANLQNGVPRGNNLSPFQRAIVRSSPHATYL